MISSVLASVVPTILNGNETHHPMDDWHMWGGWWFCLIVLVAVVLVIGILVYLMIREEGNRGSTSVSDKSAEKLLDERYARGEISKDEYKEMKEGMKK